MNNSQVMLITGTRKGIGEQLAKHYVTQGFKVVGCSRKDVEYKFENYQHFCLDVSHEVEVKKLFFEINAQFANELITILTQSGFVDIELKKDTNDRDRMIKAIWK